MASEISSRNDILDRLHQMFDSYPDAALAIEILEENGQPADYLYLYANKASETILKAPMERYVGKRHNQFFGIPDPHINLYHSAIKNNTSGTKWLFNPEIDSFTSITYSKLEGNICLITGRFEEDATTNAKKMIAANNSAYEVIVAVNLTRGTYQIMNYDSEYIGKIKEDGTFDELFLTGLKLLPEEWKQSFIDAFSYDNQMAAFGRGENVISLDHQQYGEDGSVHWVRTQAIKLETQIGDDISQLTTTKLIDDFKQVQEQMIRERQALYDTLPGGIVRCILAEDLPIITCNKDFETIAGYIPEAYHGFYDVVFPDDRKKVKETIKECIMEGEPIEFECRVFNSDGIRWVNCLGQVLTGAGHEDECFFLCFDTTEQKRSTQVLENERQRYKRVMDSVNCAYIEYEYFEDGRCHLKEVNAEALNILKMERYNKNELFFDPEENLYHGDLSQWIKMHREAAAHPGVRQDFALRLDGKKGIQWIAGYITCIEDSESITYMQGTFMNVDAQKRQEAANHKAEMELALKDRTLHMALENASMAYISYYPKDNVLRLGEGAFKMLGRKDRGDFTIEEGMEELVYPDDRAEVMEAFQRAIDGHERVQVDFRVHIKDVIWCRMTLSVVGRNKKHEAVAIVGFISDITEDRAQSLQMQESFNAIADIFSFIHRVHVPSKTVIAIRQNDRIGEIVGARCGVDFIFDKLVNEVVPAHLRDEYKEFLEPERVCSILSPEHRTETREVPFLTADNQIRWMRANIILESMKDGKVESYILALQDISKEKANEAKAVRLTRERNEMADTISAMFFAAFVINLDEETYSTIKKQQTCHANLPEQGPYPVLVEGHMGFLEEKFVTRARNFFKLENLKERLSADNPVMALELPVTAEERPLWLRMSVVLTQQVEGKPQKASLIMQDVTAERERELQKQEALNLAFQSATQANEAKSSFLSSMSHDIRTPLNAVIGMTSIAAKSADNPQKVLSCLAKIDKSSQHLLSLINEVLDMSRIEAGQINLMEEPFSLGDLVDDLVTIIRPQAQEKHQKLQVNIGKLQHEDVYGDNQRLQQCCLNFLSNAVKYTPDGGRISLTLNQRPSLEAGRACYEFIFEDNGYGMDSEFLPHLFEPFSREEDSRTSTIQGSGLGMAIAYNIVKMMDGDIDVVSHRDKGTKFTVTVYIKTGEGVQIDSKILEGLNILLVDKDVEQGYALRQILDEEGLSGKWVSAPGAIPENKKWDIVIFDGDDAGSDWQESLAQLRGKLGEEIPILMLWEGDWADISQEASASGASAIVSKPIFRSRLIQALIAIKGNSHGSDGDLTPLDQLGQCNCKGYRFLIVEDNMINLEIAKELFSVTGAELESAENGQVAVDMVAASPEGYYDLIFMDVQMPVMNGYQATKAIRELDRKDAKKMPIFAMTANAFAEDVAMAKKSGMDEHLAKPLDLAAASKLIRKWLKI